MTITYELDGKLYLNLTNRCTNNCSFCIRNTPEALPYDLYLEREPDIAEIIREIGTAEKYEEVIFCGFGEPMIRLPALKEVAAYLKQLGKKVRLNTNGQADLIWNRPVAPELAGLIDAISISLNAGSEARYQELCASRFGRGVFDAIVSFALQCVQVIPEVTLSVVDVLSISEIQACAAIAEGIGASFRVRPLAE